MINEDLTEPQTCSFVKGTNWFFVILRNWRIGRMNDSRFVPISRRHSQWWWWWCGTAAERGSLRRRRGRVRCGVLGDRSVVVRLRPDVPGRPQATPQDAVSVLGVAHQLCRRAGRQQAGSCSQPRRLRVRSATCRPFYAVATIAIRLRFDGRSTAYQGCNSLAAVTLTYLFI